MRVVAASGPEREGAKQLLQTLHQERQRVPQLARIWVDGGFSGEEFLHWVIDTFRWILEVVLRPEGAQGFILLPKRWTVDALTVGCIGAVVSISIMSDYPLLQNPSFTLP